MAMIRVVYAKRIGKRQKCSINLESEMQGEILQFCKANGHRVVKKRPPETVFDPVTRLYRHQLAWDVAMNVTNPLAKRAKFGNSSDRSTWKNWP